MIKIKKMEDKKIEHKERINYVRDTSLGKEVLIGSMVNTPGVFQGDDEEDLKRMALSFGKAWLHFMGQELSAEDPFELKELTEEEWEAKDDNIDYWEIERIKRLLARPTIKDKFRNIIVDALKNSEGFGVFGIGTQADDILTALINQPNK